MNLSESLGLARYLISTGSSIDDAVINTAIPEQFRFSIKQTLEEEQMIILQPARMVVNDTDHLEWLNAQDRSEWYYWPTLRQYLLTTKGLSIADVQSLDTDTDRVLARLASPNITGAFDKRGLVLGFVQSGKTSNYTALIAKAADAGYKLFIVLTGMDNALRLQTQRRLQRELVGGQPGRSVPLPPIGHQWHEFTRNDINGDFQAGGANTAALQGSQPVILVVKKNGNVLRRLLAWLDSAPEEIKQTVPLMVIDDEADLGSIDTRGSRQTEEDVVPDDYEPPTVINGLIRGLLNRFQRKAYVAYTATPFANVLIPYDNFDPHVLDDLYPRDFIVDLPKPTGYFGAEELFGRMDDVSEQSVDGINVIRRIPESDLNTLKELGVPPIMETAILSFILAGAARMKREGRDFPATMLVHVSFRRDDHHQTRRAVESLFKNLKDEWRYDRLSGVRDKLRKLWENDFQNVTEQLHPEKAIDFQDIEEHITPFFESIKVLTINSDTDDILDYDLEPNLKTIAVGGNKLSRGLTLEGLLVSVYVRSSDNYDTLMQMGRWFGFRRGYEDLTRIYTTKELADRFSDLALAEHRLREDLQVFEDHNLTPFDVGIRIMMHPAMQVTSRLKRRFANSITIGQNYSGQLEQTFKFPLDDLTELAYISEHNLALMKRLLPALGVFENTDKGPLWRNIPADKIIQFLKEYKTYADASNIDIPRICSYIEDQQKQGELVKWIIAICGRESTDPNLGEADWGLKNSVRKISRTRLRGTDSLGVITSPGDEAMGFSTEQLSEMQTLIDDEEESKNRAARRVRSPDEGLIMLYPISKKSAPTAAKARGTMRCPLYKDVNEPLARDLIGMAISFPHSKSPQVVQSYMTGALPWRRIE